MHLEAVRGSAIPEQQMQVGGRAAHCPVSFDVSGGNLNALGTDVQQSFPVDIGGMDMQRARQLGTQMGDLRGCPPVHAADVTNEITHLPVGASRNRCVEIGPGSHGCQPVTLPTQRFDRLENLHTAQSVRFGRASMRRCKPPTDRHGTVRASAPRSRRMEWLPAR
jgi:hypothetical protein